MVTTATAPERKVSAAEAREVAEAAREQEWVAPSFVRDLFLGKFRLDLIHPYPEQDPEEVRRAQPVLDTSPPPPRWRRRPFRRRTARRGCSTARSCGAPTVPRQSCSS